VVGPLHRAVGLLTQDHWVIANLERC